MSINPSIRALSMLVRATDTSVRDAEFAVYGGTGAPSGGALANGQTLEAAQNALYFRTDGAVATSLYVTANGGTAWTVFDPSTTTGASITISDADALLFGTPGTDLVITANGTDAVVTGTGVLNFVDSLALAFGTGKDITATFTTPNLVIATAVADTGAVHYGVDGAGVDVVFFGDTVGEKITWDQSTDDLICTAAVGVLGAGSTVVPVIPLGAHTTSVAAAAAIPITNYYSTMDSNAGATTQTLADGAQKHQLKKIQLIVDGGDDVVTPANLSGGTIITFADAGDFAVLAWDGTNWVAIELGNDADGATAPVLS